MERGRRRKKRKKREKREKREREGMMPEEEEDEGQ